MYTTPSNKFSKILKKKEEKKKTTNWTITLTKLESPKGTGPKPAPRWHFPARVTVPRDRRPALWLSGGDGWRAPAPLQSTRQPEGRLRESMVDTSFFLRDTIADRAFRNFG